MDSGDILEDPKGKKDKARRKPLPATYEPGIALLSLQLRDGSHMRFMMQINARWPGSN